MCCYRSKRSMALYSAFLHKRITIGPPRGDCNTVAGKIAKHVVTAILNLTLPYGANIETPLQNLASPNHYILFFPWCYRENTSNSQSLLLAF